MVMILRRGGVVVFLLLGRFEHLAKEQSVEVELVRAVPEGSEIGIVDETDDGAFA